MCEHGFIGACGECDGAGQAPPAMVPITVYEAVGDCVCEFDCGHGNSCADDGREFHVHGDEDDCPVHGRMGSAR